MSEVDQLRNENRELRSLAAKMIEFLNQQRPLEALGRKRWERMKTNIAATLRGTEIEPEEIACDFCGSTLAASVEESDD